MNALVVNIRNESYDVYIGRRSKGKEASIWRNPFKIGVDGDRNECIKKYREYLINNEVLMSKIKELDGKKLGCWCKPLPCHGDVIVEILRGME